MPFIKLTSFDSWSPLEEDKYGDVTPPYLLINTDHVLRVEIAHRSRVIGEREYRPTNLIFADKIVKVAESPECFYEMAVPACDRRLVGRSYVQGFRDDRPLGAFG